MNTRLLSWRLRNGGASLPVRSARSYREVTDSLGRLEITGADTARFVGDGAPFDLTLTRPVRAEIKATDPKALWVLNLKAGEQTPGDLVAFAPLRILATDVASTIAIQDTLLPDLKRENLGWGDNLLNRGAIAVGGARVAVIGQPIVGAVEANDAERFTWWLPSGAALEVQLVRDGRAARLEIVEVVSAERARHATCGPNALLECGPDGSLTIVETPEPLPASFAELLHLHRSGAVDAWANYALIERAFQQELQERRTRHPLTFVEAHADGGTWIAKADVDEDASAAWLGSSVREGRWMRIDQPAALASDESLKFELVEGRIRGPGLLEVRLRGEGDTKRLPDKGTLEARVNIGSKIKNDREREALERLGQGRAGIRHLADLLARPEQARPPQRRALPYPPKHDLDPHQRAAVEMILGAQDLVAIQGPPGTGKTRVIVEALRQMALAREPGSPPLRVLISSVQNEAVGNVVDGLADMQGLLVRVVHRRAKNEEESLEFSSRREAGRERVVEALRAQSGASDIGQRLALIEEAHRELGGLRRLRLAEEDAALPRTRQRLTELVETLAPYLSLTLRDDGLELASSPPPTLEETVESAEGSEPAHQRGTPEFPTSAERVPEWWGVASLTWPAETIAEVGGHVDQVVGALAMENPLLRTRRLAKAWSAFTEATHDHRLKLSDPQTASLAEDSAKQPEEDTADPLDADRWDVWIARAIVHLRQHREEIERGPEAIVHRFLDQLTADAHAWEAILDRHGGVVASTCSMAARARDAEEEFFDVVIIDEAGRASPFELLIPLVHGRCVVLVGDHRQLPPMIDETVIQQAASSGQVLTDLSKETLFASVFARLPTANKQRLGTQYRMHSAIGDVVNQVFYQPHGEPVSSYFSGDRAAKKAPRWGTFGDRPLVWVDVPGPRRGVSERNPSEVDAVISALRRYPRDDTLSLAIVCPYRAQKRLLEERLQQETDLPIIPQVRTIDSVQGREYDVVFFCTVRNDEKAGFMASENRVNVAISRARSQLVVFGSRRALTSRRVNRAAPHLVELVDLISTAPPGESSQ